MECRTLVRGVMLACAVGLPGVLAAQEARKPLVVDTAPTAQAETAKPPTKEVKWAPAVKPKPLSEHVTRGLKWLVEHQLKNGSWGQGEESATMGGGATMKDIPSVADTSMAALALLRAGNTPAKGDYAKRAQRGQLRLRHGRGVGKDTLEVTITRGTRIQQKLGPYIDTFAASLLLAEVNNQMPDAAGQQRLAAAMNKLLVKIQKNQRPDGTWGGQGWATTLQQNMAVRGLNTYSVNGGQVNEKVREKAESQARKGFDKPSGTFAKGDAAGVDLYAAGATLNSMTKSGITNKQQQPELEKKAKDASQPEAVRKAAHAKLKNFADAEHDQADAARAVIARLDDKQFIAGFGSNGGEEFLSYMNIGESLVVKGDKTWKSWDKSITENLVRVQNNDGSWTGHHCITGRTVCTAAALLVLMVDRTTLPISEKMQRRQ